MGTDFWELAARRDPLWAVLSEPSKRGRLWDLPAFFETGTREISLLLYQLRRLGHPPAPGRALDFGCGVGRLTQPLASTFAEAVGVDASPTMIELARRLNLNAAARYVLNQSPALEQFATGSFDFVYSDIVLQHLEPDAAKGYITEFLRLLKPGGVTVFQLPSHRRAPEEYPARPVRMPDNAYSASLRPIDGLQSRMAPQETAVVTVEVRNIGSMPWNQGEVGTIRAGNHWRSPSGAMLIQDDGRTRLPDVVAAGAPVRLPIVIQAPPEPGEFVCELDLVHEGITWFADVTSSTAWRTPITVSASGAADPGLPIAAEPSSGVVPRSDFPDIYAALGSDDAADIPPFPMHGIPRARVVDLIERHGGAVFFTEEDERGGPEWHGYRYFVEKRR